MILQVRSGLQCMISKYRMKSDGKIKLQLKLIFFSSQLGSRLGRKDCTRSFCFRHLREGSKIFPAQVGNYINFLSIRSHEFLLDHHLNK